MIINYKKVSKFYLFISIICFVSFSSGCSKSDNKANQADRSQTIATLNNNVRSLISLIESTIQGDTITSFLTKYSDNGLVSYEIKTNQTKSYTINHIINNKKLLPPNLSIGKDGDDYFWILNGQWIVDEAMNRVNVLDKQNSPLFFIDEDHIFYRLGNKQDRYQMESGQDNLVSVNSVDIDLDNYFIKFIFSASFSIDLPFRDYKCLLKNNVLNEAYFRDVFLDAGVGLSSRKSLYAADALHLTLEAISFARAADSQEEIKRQNSIVAGSIIDENGRLLYPDGQPRYKLLFVNGGSSTTHGKSLGETGLLRMKTFVANGGSYVGTCAGAFLASSGYDSYNDYKDYLHLWPASMTHTGISDGVTDFAIENDSPLLRYYSFGGDLYVKNVRHNKGGFPSSLPEGTLVLAKYYCPDKQIIHLKPGVWSYKASDSSGRVVMIGSHPEEVESGEQRDLTSAAMLYAMEGRDLVSIKGFLRNGIVRKMDKSTSDNDPNYTRIGDLQCHHFAVYIPRNARDIKIAVNSNVGCDLVLMLNRDSYPFPSFCDYASKGNGNKQELSFTSLDEGIWYVSVQCATTVSVKDVDYGFEYAGRTDVLNGFPYSIVASWTISNNGK